MNLSKLQIESDLLSRNAYQLINLTDYKEFKKKEEKLVLRYKPYYLQCSIPSSKLQLIHCLEENGFRFVEFRLRKTLNLNNYEHINSMAYYPYKLIVIQEDSQKKCAEKILLSNYSDDRFSNDPLVKSNIAKKRLLDYLNKSFLNYPREFIYGLVDHNSNRLISFMTGENINQKEVVFYLTYVDINFDKEKFFQIIETLVISELHRMGIIFIKSITSGFNVSELNTSINKLNFVVDETFIILRKIY